MPLIENYDDNKAYQKDLVFELKNMYEEISQNVNGFIRNSAEIDQAQWEPTLAGTGGGDFIYASQIGWSVRQGIFTYIWFDINWSSTTATGNLYVELPYKVTLSNQMPFMGVLQPSSINFGAGNTNLVINAIPNTYRGEIWTIGSGAATANLTVPASGRLIGYIHYIGVDDE
ncbi:MAG: hypothetical protein R6U52_01525 [Kosmotogaceae bacterium]